MGTQLIFCVETNKNCNSDYIYIKSAIEHFYVIGKGSIKLSPVYMNGKGNYSAGKVLKDIDSLKRQYRAASRNNSSVVIYCFDCDEYMSRPEDSRFLEDVKAYCTGKGYRFVWFCKDIEQVFLGKSVSDNMKRKEAASFLAKNKIQVVDVNSLRAERYQNCRSNLCSILDDYLPVRQ